ncbi:iron ABC transporter permease [Nocardioides panacisoli]|uniref:FecCD family ABC transporter permease n=1 Tax=Nocardioides panacisoli TaxID=627624 RepID=UPI001C62AC5E|nr:iron ABC transporter permease [Nocardioides panacisoli]QYJ04188.1 iron ABC transporter permease [Nocardioides panacisoli]
MTTTRPAPEVERAAPRAGRSFGASLGRVGLVAVVLLAALVAVSVASLAWGVRDIGFGTVVRALVAPEEGNPLHSVVRDQRLVRTLIGLAAGAALGVSGALLQGLTRNPIADPGLLGINAGASLAVIVAIAVFGIGQPAGFVWFAFAGAAAAAAVVYGAASVGRDGATPVKLALIGAAVTASSTSVITMVLLTDFQVTAAYRFWQVGALVNRPPDTLVTVLPFIVVGLLLAAGAARFLNAMALGEDMARGLGQHVGRGRALTLVAAVLLAGAATSLVGPIAFVGLMVPHAARAMVGLDHRRMLPISALLGPVVLLAADVLGRLVVQPSELEAGLVAAAVGAPVLIVLIRRKGGGGL